MVSKRGRWFIHRPRFPYAEPVSVQIVFVHGIRTSATMWRSQAAYLEERGYAFTAVDLPGHGTRMQEDFTLHEALHTIDEAVRAAAEKGPVLLVGHSMGGLLCLAYVGGAEQPPVAGLIAASCTSIPTVPGSRPTVSSLEPSMPFPTAGCG